MWTLSARMTGEKGVSHSPGWIQTGLCISRGIVLNRKCVHSCLFVPSTIPPFSDWHLILVITVWHSKHLMQNILSLSCPLDCNQLKVSIGTRFIGITGFYRFLMLVASCEVNDSSPEPNWCFQKVQSSEIYYFKPYNPPCPQEKKMMPFPWWRGML